MASKRHTGFSSELHGEHSRKNFFVSMGSQPLQSMAGRSLTGGRGERYFSQRCGNLSFLVRRRWLPIGEPANCLIVALSRKRRHLAGCVGRLGSDRQHLVQRLAIEGVRCTAIGRAGEHQQSEK